MGSGVPGDFWVQEIVRHQLMADSWKPGLFLVLSEQRGNYVNYRRAEPDFFLQNVEIFSDG